MFRLVKFLAATFVLSAGVQECAKKEVENPPWRGDDVPEQVVNATPGTIVIDLKDGSGDAELEQIESLLHADLDWSAPFMENGEAIITGDVQDMEAAFEILEDLPQVEVFEKSVTYEITGWSTPADWHGTTPNDPRYKDQWHMDMMGAPYGWAHTKQGEGVIVAVIDTGVTVTEDLRDTNVLEGKSFTGEPQKDGNGHGTHVAGTIAQSTNNGVGVAGIAPKATILPVKVLSNGGSGSSQDIADGIYWAVDQGAQVINLSLGGGYSPVIHKSIQEATDKGVVVVAAMGNSGREGASYPGGLEETIGVSAVGPSGKLAFYSTYGKGTDISAPGGDKSNREEDGVLQNTVRNGQDVYEYFQGTSMATPHVAGAAAILISEGVKPKDVRSVLLTSSTGYTGQWDKKYGYGQLNLESAIKSVQTSTPWRGGWMLASVLSLVVAFLLSRFADASTRFTAATSVSSFAAATIIGTYIVGPLFVIWVPSILVMGMIFGLIRFTRPVMLGALIGTATHLALMTLGVWSVFSVLPLLLVTFLALSIAGVQRLER